MSSPVRAVAALTLLARQYGLPFETLGRVEGDRLVVELVASGPAAAGPAAVPEERRSRIADTLDVRVADLRLAWTHGLERALGWDAPAAPELAADSAGVA